MKNFRRLFSLVLTVLFINTAAAFSPKLEILTPQPMPDFSFTGPGGTPTNLQNCLKQHTQDNRGKVIVLNFWSITCNPCMAEMPSLDQLAAYYSEKDLMVIPINVDPIKFIGLENFFAHNKYRYLGPYGDPKRTSQEIFKWEALPTTLLINQKGELVGRLVGQTKWDSPEALELFDRMIKGENPKKAEVSLFSTIKQFFGMKN